MDVLIFFTNSNSTFLFEFQGSKIKHVRADLRVNNGVYSYKFFEKSLSSFQEVTTEDFKELLFQDCPNEKRRAERNGIFAAIQWMVQNKVSSPKGIPRFIPESMRGISENSTEYRSFDRLISNQNEEKYPYPSDKWQWSEKEGQYKVSAYLPDEVWKGRDLYEWSRRSR